MADISDRVLKRRQKDLSDFVVNYQDQLDKAAGQYADEMAPIWNTVYNSVKNRSKEFYKKVGDLSESGNTRKIRSAMREAERLDKLANDIATDLKQAEKKLQPYYTTNLGYEFEKSYYMHLLGMEQSARVSVRTPTLNPARILGILANPWLPDGNNYSSRLRGNTIFLAQKMRETVIESVTLGLGWNEAATKLKAVTQEGYFNSVRLMRTEMNRVAALGASYSYMENADILDSKRWNATLDARTAPKDAKNDGKLYDLDYDTPVNEGIPGQRIPNHPNCRCKWSPVLSALGVSKKERIARGDGDAPDQFGERSYTKARTYEEYAKERGLPSLDKRLEVDNPKSYLRPGETLADLSKKVKRWTYKGSSITVPKPAWDTAKDFMTGIPDNIQTAFDPDGTFNEEKYFNKLKRIDDPEEYYNYVMTTSDHLVEKNFKKLEDSVDLDKPLRIKGFEKVPGIDGEEDFYTITYKMKLHSKEVTTSEIFKPWEYQNIAKFNRLDKDDQEFFYKSLVKRLNNAEDPEAKTGYKKIVSTIEDFMNNRELQENARTFREVMLPFNGGLTEAQERLLRISKSHVGHKKLRPTIDKANDWITTYVDGKNAPDKGITGYTLRKGSRAYARDLKGEVYLPSDTSVKTAIHEAGHNIHYQNKATRKLTDLFFRKRTEGLEMKTIYQGTTEKGYKDDFFNHYIGKVYRNDGNYGYGREVVSMGMGEMYENPRDFYKKDPEHFKLIYAILRGLQ